MPRQDGLWTNDLGDFSECFSSNPFADLGQSNPVGVIEQQTTRDLVLENPVLRHQVFVAQEEFLINRTADLREDSFPIH